MVEVDVEALVYVLVSVRKTIGSNFAESKCFAEKLFRLRYRRERGKSASGGNRESRKLSCRRCRRF